METDQKIFDSYKEAVKAIHSTLDIQEVLRRMVNMLVEVLNVKGCAIRLLNPKRRTLELVASHGLSEKYIKKGPVDVDLSASEVMEGKTVFIPKISVDPRVQYKKEAIEEGIHGMLSVPLSVKGGIIGILRLYTPKDQTFSQEEVRFVEALAEIGAIAIENARMHESIREDYETMVSEIYTFIGYRRSV